MIPFMPNIGLIRFNCQNCMVTYLNSTNKSNVFQKNLYLCWDELKETFTRTILQKNHEPPIPFSSNFAKFFTFRIR